MNAELESIDAVGAVLSWRDSEYYPERLAQFDDAPAGITARGNLHLLTQPMIAIVGARNASINAQRHAHNIASELGKHGYIIVSGMARGIDAAAHRGALDIGTIGNIAGGIDIVYLPENADLFEEVASRGLLLAEMPPATKPTPKHSHPQPGDCQSGSWCCGCRSGAPVRLADHRQRSRNPVQRCDGCTQITA